MANEMSTRLTDLLNRIPEIEVGTFHSISYKLIKLYSNIVSDNLRRYTILDESESKKLIKNIMKDQYDNKTKDLFTPANVKKILS